ncbi:MAG TPA: EVE domain-containing protein [Gemmatimonadaceae bacterium]|jgi:predicted RNA-binding protein with PUA-like domain|nr:EVE domain-containing protein [Gemmatimonadaceae bacterium]
MRHWLFKSEPSAFSWDDLWAAPRRTTNWSGVRNYQARNFLRDEIKKGDLVLFYHSSAEPTAAVGVAEVTREGYPEDPKDPTWYQVDVTAREPFTTPVTLAAMRKERALADMVLLKKGSRLSIQPVTPDEWRLIAKLGRRSRPKDALPPLTR